MGREMIKIKQSKTADSRTCDGSKVTWEFHQEKERHHFNNPKYIPNEKSNMLMELFRNNVGWLISQTEKLRILIKKVRKAIKAHDDEYENMTRAEALTMDKNEIIDWAMSLGAHIVCTEILDIIQDKDKDTLQVAKNAMRKHKDTIDKL